MKIPRLTPVLSATAIILPLTVSSTSTAAVVLAGWHTWGSGNENANVTNGDASGLAVESAGTWAEQGESASNDGNYGSFADTAAPVNGSGTVIGINEGAGSYDFTVTAGANELTLETFHFDAKIKRGNSPEFWAVTVLSGSITTGAVANGTLTGPLGAAGPTDHDDLDLDLTGLADNTLATGESATFRIAFSGGNPFNTDQKTFMDNVAITGTAVPEPSSLSLLGLGLTGLLIRRRK